jgi:hypothetical protein
MVHRPSPGKTPGSGQVEPALNGQKITQKLNPFFSAPQRDLSVSAFRLFLQAPKRSGFHPIASGLEEKA